MLRNPTILPDVPAGTMGWTAQTNDIYNLFVNIIQYMTKKDKGNSKILAIFNKNKNATKPS